MRSFASRDSGRELSNAIGRSIEVCRSVGFDLLIVETSARKVTMPSQTYRTFHCM